MANLIPVTEEMHPEKEWYALAAKQTSDTLVDFIKHVMNDYCHDYGTVVHAISACALAAAWAANNEPSGGITGFQAGFVMWDFIRQWTYSDNKCGMKLVDFDKMLYPQYQDHFKNTISHSTWERIQKIAKEKMTSTPDAHPEVLKHWAAISDGVVPFGFEIKE